MLTKLRGDVRAAMDGLPLTRRPALRRSDDPDMLLATDLPLVADDEVVERFLARMKRMGVLVSRQGNWLLMNAELDAPEHSVPARADGELGCCISLLERHPSNGTDARALRALAKAVECGRGEVQRLCAELHAAWAGMLRQHQELPGALLPYLYFAGNMTKE